MKIYIDLPYSPAEVKSLTEREARMRDEDNGVEYALKTEFLDLSCDKDIVRTFVSGRVTSAKEESCACTLTMADREVERIRDIYDDIEWLGKLEHGRRWRAIWSACGNYCVFTTFVKA
jgi:hypothetical protein